MRNGFYEVGVSAGSDGLAFHSKQLPSLLLEGSTTRLNKMLTTTLYQQVRIILFLVLCASYILIEIICQEK